MFSPAIRQRLDELVAAYRSNGYSSDEFSRSIGQFSRTYGVSSVLKQLPEELRFFVGRGISLETQDVLDNECLTPEDWPVADYLVPYYSAVASKLLEFDSHKRLGIASVVCLPSFEPEWSLRLIGSKRDGYSLVHFQAEEQIWGTPPNSNVSIKTAEAGTNAELVTAIESAWSRMLQTTRFRKTAKAGLDGETYHFCYYGMSAKTWSPTGSTAPGRLVELVHLLVNFVKATEAERAKLATEAIDAANWFSADD